MGEWLPDTDPKIASGFKKYKFKMETHNNSISLTIPRVKKEHEGLYYCGQFSSENFTLSRGTFLVVTGKDLNQIVKCTYGNVWHFLSIN